MQRIAQQEKAGQPIRAFCRGLNEHLFYAWRQRLRSENKPVAFALIETKSAAAAEASSQGIELLLCGGERLRIPADSATFRLVLNVLREQQR